MKNLSDFVSKSNIRPSISGVLVTPEKIVATDSFKLIEIKRANAVKEAIIVKLPKGLKTFDRISDEKLYHKNAEYPIEKIDDTFPAYESIIPTTEPKMTIIVNPKFLAEICAAFSKEVTIALELHGEDKPIVITARDTRGDKKEDIRALLMQCKQ